MLTNQDLIKIGFTEIPHFTVMNSVIYDLGRNRELAAGCVGTPNETVFICEVDGIEVTDAVCIHNYDYDGYLTIEKVKAVIEVLKSPKEKEE